ncbi:hypothetical protein C0993_005141 [Termitomyces sp. T159_Od127]|nr:hypothetical protein C0993_005141 [Termitomyces sp. T159_Od127]
MSTYMHTYQPVGYQTNAYKRPMLKNYYVMSTPQPLYLAPLIKHYPILVPRYWAPDQNQATAGTYQQVLPGGMLETPPGAWAPLALAHTSTAFFTLGQYYAQPAPAMPPPSQEYPETYYCKGSAYICKTPSTELAGASDEWESSRHRGRQESDKEPAELNQVMELH